MNKNQSLQSNLKLFNLLKSFVKKKLDCGLFIFDKFGLFRIS